MRAIRIPLIALMLTSPLLAACASDFDPTDLTDKLDFFHLADKKKLPGERKEVFPGGVPGVQQGIPADLVKGYQAPETAAVEPAAEPKPEPPPQKPKPRVVRRTPPKSQPTPVTVSPQRQQAPQQQQQQQAQQPAWPDPKPQAQQQQQTGTQAPWPSPQQQQPSAWPDAPPPNTFQR